MEIFAYLAEEGNYVEKKLAHVIGTFGQATRETVFDDVKLICDAIAGYLGKQEELLFNKLSDLESAYKAETAKHRNRMQALQGELETLTMVHVDEPGYDNYLNSLLNRVKDCTASLAELGSFLKGALPASRLQEINDNLEKIVHSSVGYNEISLQKS